MAYQDHYDGQGNLICDCPKDGVCCDCGKSCTDHDLVADQYLCRECLDKSWAEYEGWRVER